MMYFILYPRNLDNIKYTKPATFFHSSCAPQKKSRSYGTDIQLISVIDFTALTSFWSVFPPKALVLHRGRVSNFVYQKL